MGKNCGGCSCDGKDCGPKKETIKYSTKPKDDLFEFFTPLPKQRKDDTPLSETCQHYPYGKISRYQCGECIKEWVEAHDDYIVSAQITLFREDKKKVAADRIEQAFKDKKQKRRIP